MGFPGHLLLSTSILIFLIMILYIFDQLLEDKALLHSTVLFPNIEAVLFRNAKYFGLEPLSQPWIRGLC